MCNEDCIRVLAKLLAILDLSPVQFRATRRKEVTFALPKQPWVFPRCPRLLLWLIVFQVPPEIRWEPKMGEEGCEPH